MAPIPNPVTANCWGSYQFSQNSPGSMPLLIAAPLPVQTTAEWPPDRAFGATFGLLRGALIVVLLSFLAVWVDAARELEVSEGLASVPPLGSSRVARASGAVVEGIAMSAVADQGPMAALAVRLAVHPTETLNSVQNLLDHEGFEELQSDRMFWTYVEHGAIAVHNLVYPG